MSEQLTKPSDIQKQKAYVANKRSASNKIVKRGMRKRINVVESVTVKLVNELRQWFEAQQQTNDKSLILLGLLAKQATGTQLSDEEIAALGEFVLSQQTESEGGVEPSPDASPGG